MKAKRALCMLAAILLVIAMMLMFLKNSEGYSDPTAYQAMMNLEIEELRFKKLLRSIKDVCDLADFEIEGRVVLIDKRSGRVWR